MVKMRSVKDFQISTYITRVRKIIITDSLYLFPLVLLLKFRPGLLFGIYFYVSSFCLSLCVCLCELGKTATSPVLEGVTLCKSYPFVDCEFWVSLAGQLELECMWAVGSTAEQASLGLGAVAGMGMGQGKAPGANLSRTALVGQLEL